jgi:hypothetical protein
METVTSRNELAAASVIVWILGFSAICLAAGWGLSSDTLSARVELRDLSDATFVEIRTLGGDVAMSGELRNRVDPLGNIEKDAALSGTQFDRVIGEIEIEIPRPGAPDQGQEIEIDVIALRPFTIYQVFVNDQPAARFTTDDRGSVDVELVTGPS